jgi:hypothetical protein
VSTPGQAGNPSGESEPGLEGDLGISSERVGRFEGVEGTGTLASAQGRTHGDSSTYEDPTKPVTEEHRQVQEVEENPAALGSHDDIRAANPHPHREDSSDEPRRDPEDA